MDIATALEFARTCKFGVLTTIKRDGRPQLSNVSLSVTADGVMRISITADRAKYLNLLRDPRASVHVTNADYSAYAVLEGVAELSPIAAAVDDAVVAELVDMYRAVAGEHPDWHEYREAMVSNRRVVLHLRPTHTYGLVR